MTLCFVCWQNLVTQTSLQRKKSLPDFQEIPRSTSTMSREEVSYLGSARREEVRRQADERDRLRANPLLYLVSPQVKVMSKLFHISIASFDKKAIYIMESFMQFIRQTLIKLLISKVFCSYKTLIKQLVTP